MPALLPSPLFKSDFYQLIFLDFDGTLLDSRKQILPRTRELLLKAQAQGMQLVFATGRPPQGILKYARELHAEHSYAICFNGSAGFDLASLQPVFKAYELGKYVKQLAHFAHQYHCHLHSYTWDRGLILEQAQNPYSMREVDHNHVPFTVINYDFLKDEEKLFKTLVVGEPELLDEVRRDLPEHLAEVFTLMRTDPNFLEFLPRDCTKGSGLLHLCKKLGVDTKHVIAFGDAENDMLMLKYAGLGVAMANAMPEAKQAADVITLSNNDDGIAAVLEQILK